MSNPVAGWYPDPAGDASKLRYWDGGAWTDRFMDRPPASDDVHHVESAASQQPFAGAAQTIPQNQGAYATQGQGAGTPNIPYNVQVNIVDTTPQTYQLSSEDSTLRLIAFIFALISTISVAMFIIPLCWMVPMTVHCWSLYKGTKPNTVAFGVCTLIFLSIVSGILLLISTKEEQ